MKLEPDDPEGTRAAVRAMRDEEMGLSKLRPIKNGKPPRNAPYLFWSPGNPRANNRNAISPHFTVDEINDHYPRGLYQYPEAPYTHWMPLPAAPETKR